MCKELKLVPVQCSQLVCVIVYYSFVGFQFFIILTVNKWIIQLMDHCQPHPVSVKLSLEIILLSLVLLLRWFKRNKSQIHLYSAQFR